jgi:nitrite reductase (NO-forming)
MMIGERPGLTRRVSLVLIVLLTGVLAACSGASASGPTTPIAGTPVATTSSGAQQLTIRGLDAMRFEPNVITVRAGQPVELTLQNDGSNDHDFALSDGVGQPVKVVVKGGQSATSTFTLDKPGTYSFTCSQFGHAGAGMQGTITAQ